VDVIRDVDIHATATDDVSTQAFAVAGGLIGAGTGAQAIASVEPTVKATVAGKVKTFGSVTVSSNGVGDAEARATGVSVAALVSAGGSIANSSITPTVTTTVASESLSAAGDITLEAAYNRNEQGVVRNAEGEVNGPRAVALASGGGILSGLGGSATATSGAKVEVASSGVLTSDKDVVLRALSNNESYSAARGLVIGALGLGITLSDSLSQGQTKVLLDASQVNADSLSIDVDAGERAFAESHGAAAGAAVVARPDSRATVEPLVNQQTASVIFVHSPRIDVAKSVVILNKLDSAANAVAIGASGGLIAVGESTATSKLAPQVQTTLSGTIHAGEDIFADTIHNLASQALNGTAQGLKPHFTTVLHFTRSDIDPTSDALTVANHGFQTGDAVRFNRVPGLQGQVKNLDPQTAYYVIRLDDQRIGLATTREAARRGNRIDVAFEGSPDSITGFTLERLLGAAAIAAAPAGGIASSVGATADVRANAQVLAVVDQFSQWTAGQDVFFTAYSNAPVGASALGNAYGLVGGGSVSATTSSVGDTLAEVNVGVAISAGRDLEIKSLSLHEAFSTGLAAGGAGVSVFQTTAKADLGRGRDPLRPAQPDTVAVVQNGSRLKAGRNLAAQSLAYMDSQAFADVENGGIIAVGFSDSHARINSGDVGVAVIVGTENGAATTLEAAGDISLVSDRSTIVVSGATGNAVGFGAGVGAVANTQDRGQSQVHLHRFARIDAEEDISIQARGRDFASGRASGSVAGFATGVGAKSLVSVETTSRVIADTDSKITSPRTITIAAPSRNFITSRATSGQESVAGGTSLTSTTFATPVSSIELRGATVDARIVNLKSDVENTGIESSVDSRFTLLPFLSGFSNTISLDSQATLKPESLIQVRDGSLVQARERLQVQAGQSNNSAASLVFNQSNSVFTSGDTSNSLTSDFKANVVLDATSRMEGTFVELAVLNGIASNSLFQSVTSGGDLFDLTTEFFSQSHSRVYTIQVDGTIVLRPGAFLSVDETGNNIRSFGLNTHIESNTIVVDGLRPQVEKQLFLLASDSTHSAAPATLQGVGVVIVTSNWGDARLENFSSKTIRIDSLDLVGLSVPRNPLLSEIAFIDVALTRADAIRVIADQNSPAGDIYIGNFGPSTAPLGFPIPIIVNGPIRTRSRVDIVSRVGGIVAAVNDLVEGAAVRLETDASNTQDVGNEASIGDSDNRLRVRITSSSESILRTDQLVIESTSSVGLGIESRLLSDEQVFVTIDAKDVSLLFEPGQRQNDLAFIDMTYQLNVSSLIGLVLNQSLTSLSSKVHLSAQVDLGTGHLFVGNRGDVNISESKGNLRIGNVFTPGSVALTAFDGSISQFLSSCSFACVTGANITLTAVNGDIGGPRIFFQPSEPLSVSTTGILSAIAAKGDVYLDSLETRPMTLQSLQAKDVAVLTARGPVVDGNPNLGFDAFDINAREVAIVGQGNIGSLANPIEINTSALATSNAAGGTFLKLFNAFVESTEFGPVENRSVAEEAIEDFVGWSAAGDLVITSANGIILREDVTAGGNISLISTDGRLEVGRQVVVDANGNELLLAAGDDLTVTSTARLESTAVILLQVDKTDLDSTGGQLDLSGLSKAATVEIRGGTADDVLRISGAFQSIPGPQEVHAPRAFIVEGDRGNDTATLKNFDVRGGVLNLAGFGDPNDRAFLTNVVVRDSVGRGLTAVDWNELEIRNSQFSNNAADGIDLFAVPNIHLVHVTSDANGRAGLLIEPGLAPDDTTSILVESSTISRNRDSGIKADEAIVTLINSTVSGNQTNDSGGGINLTNGSQLFLHNSTVTDNHADKDRNLVGDGGGILVEPGSSAELQSSIVAGNFVGFLFDDVLGELATTSRFNLIGVIDGATGISGVGNLVGTSSRPLLPRLGPLQINNGITETHRPLTEGFISPAINSGLNSLTLETDQRGLPRVVLTDSIVASLTGSDGTDIGAVETSAVDQTIIIDLGGEGGNGSPTVEDGPDWGDAPAPYPTLSSQNGAVHTSAGPRLGAQRDSELDGEPRSDALGDDIRSAADEDGIRFVGALFTGQTDAAIRIDVQSAPAGARLDAWIDFNADGSWGGPNELIFDSVFVREGGATLHFDVPSWASLGRTYARFRLSTSGNLGPGGAALDGEVEDYAVEIESPSQSSGVFDDARTIVAGAGNLQQVVAADLDGDGDVDIAAVSAKGPASSSTRLAWYENSGQQTFLEHVLNTAAESGTSLFADDLDGDGRMDLIATFSVPDRGRVAWYANNGDRTFTEKTIVSFRGASSVFPVDWDADGDLDVLASSITSPEILLLTNLGSGEFSEDRVLATGLEGIDQVRSADFDRDGDLDLLLAQFTGSRYVLSLLSNEGSGDQFFSAKPLDTATSFGWEVTVADFDADRRLDLIVSALTTDQILGLVQEGITPPVTLAANLERVRSTFAADLDGDGDIDLLAAAQGVPNNNGASLQGDEVVWLENVGFDGFVERGLSQLLDGPATVFAADLDGDGDLDAIAGSLYDGKITWFENVDPDESVEGGFDWGDAPSSYLTSQSVNGAHHFVAGPQFGPLRDAERDGTPLAAANGDDTREADDDDGIAIDQLYVGQLLAFARIQVRNPDPFGHAKLDAWIDFDGDGNWGSAGEQIFDSVPLVPGEGLYKFSVPSWARSGLSYARFRISSAGNLGMAGPADDGEVEDYALFIAPPVFTGGNTHSEQLVSDGVPSVQQLLAADFDRDGDMDLVSASTRPAGASSRVQLVWHENLGNQTFTQHVLDNGVRGVSSLAIADLDGDAWPDVVAALAQGNDGRIVWYRNQGDSTFSPQVISSVLGSATVTPLDFDRDGDVDLVANNPGQGGLLELRNDGSGTFTASVQPVTVGNIQEVVSADLDRDGDLDLVFSEIRNGRFLVRAAMASDQLASFSVKELLNRPVTIPGRIVLGDLLAEGTMQVLVTLPGSGELLLLDAQGVIAPRTIASGLSSPLRASVADLDGDGDQDILAAVFGAPDGGSSPANGDQVSWWENRGEDGFRQRSISNLLDNPSAVLATDLDGDGDLDTVSASFYDGQIVWYENLGVDFGDAPAPYATTLSDAALAPAFGPQLGALRDSEPDDIPDLSAGSDDSTGRFDDDDGVFFPHELSVGRTSAEVVVLVQRAADSGAHLDAWIDFNADGSWDGVGEHIIDSALVHNGDTTFAFDVPSWTTSGPTYARFRISSLGGAAPRGVTQDGEIEDYLIDIQPPAGTGVFDSPRTVNVDLNRAFAVTAADLDGDGRVDLVAGDLGVQWQRNLGGGQFGPPQEIASSGDAPLINALATADMEGDGDLDVFIMLYSTGEVLWFENDGTPLNGGWGRRLVGSLGSTGAAVLPVDVNGDGDLDLLASSDASSQLFWFDNDNSQSFTRRSLSTQATSAYSLQAADIDGDGDLDVVTASNSRGVVEWLENNGLFLPTFTAHVIANAVTGARTAWIADFDNDGDQDVAVGSNQLNQFTWYANDGEGHFISQAILATNQATTYVVAADMDGDRDQDLITSSSATSSVHWYENVNGQFAARTLAADSPGSNQVVVADVDGDNALDIVAVNRGDLGDGRLTWFRNNGSDFGDAPSPYPTLSDSLGAEHRAIGPTLGANRDTESNGRTLNFAFGDDDGGSTDDEDGVVLPSAVLVGQQNVQLTIDVRNAQSGAFIDAWIDFDGNGNWFGARERIANGVAVVNGQNTLTFDVPSTAAPGVTYLRVRLSTAGRLSPVGLAADGEVEDEVIFISPAAAPRLLSVGSTIATLPSFGRSLETADLDGDGDMDGVTAITDNDAILWQRNSGNQVFANVVVGNMESPVSAIPADLDGDGRLDLVAHSEIMDEVTWFRQNPNGTFTKFVINAPDPDANPSNAVNGDVDRPARPSIADLDADGDLDVVAVGQQNGRLTWYENRISSGVNTTWVAHVVPNGFTTAASLAVADLDQDGALDLAMGLGVGGGKIVWFRNTGGGEFVRNLLIGELDLPLASAATDLDHDGDQDLVVLDQNLQQIVWLENTRDDFVTRVVAANIEGLFDMQIADLDGDGDMDIVSVSLLAGLQLHENRGGGQFVTKRLATVGNDAIAASVADIDGDGDLDLLSTFLYSNDVRWLVANEVDFGDAPTPYPVSLSQNGARHMAQGPTLGSQRDADLEGISTAESNVDDFVDIDDDDGLTAFSGHLGQADASATIVIANAPLGARLDAWIDFNGDGSWGGAGEQIAVGLLLGNGSHTIHFSIPADAVVGAAAARLRLSNEGDLSPSGPALDGEVEDHLVQITPAPGLNVSWGNAVELSRGAPGVGSVIAIDLDQDLDMDLVAAATESDEVLWYENRSGVFTARVLNQGDVSGSFHDFDNGDLDGPTQVVAADLDGDGDVDLAITSFLDNRISWLENDGAERFTRRVIDDGSLTIAAWLQSADVDGDGDQDLVAAGRYDSGATWFENLRGGQFSRHFVDAHVNAVSAMTVGDLNRDGRIDIAVGADTATGSLLVVMENDGAGEFSRRVIARESLSISTLLAADIDRNGRLDLVAAFASSVDTKSGRLIWFDQVSEDAFRQRTIAEDSGRVISMSAADIDGDGDRDLIAVTSTAGVLKTLVNDGRQQFAVGDLVLTSPVTGFLAVADFSGDGDLDLAIADPFKGVISTIDGELVDWGDAPAPFPTQRSQQGAHHAAIGPRLGAVRDSESDGRPSVIAVGDDALGSPDDEDGVSVSNFYRVGQVSSTVAVVVSNAPQGAKLDAWIDFNGDGKWSVTEQIARNLSVVNGTNSVVFDVPLTAATGNVFGRFRLSSHGGLPPIGGASDGEVEDHRIVIQPLSESAGLLGFSDAQSTLGQTQEIPVDLDRNGQVDILSLNRNRDLVLWSRSQAESFVTVVVTSDLKDIVRAFPADVDNDGDYDVVAASSGSGRVAWFENDGNQFFTMRLIDSNLPDASWVAASDIDQDGDLDVLATSAQSNLVVWYEQTSDHAFTRRRISDAVNGAAKVVAADVDQDGDDDLLAAAATGGSVAFFKNQGRGVFVRDPFSPAMDGVTQLLIADLDGDRDLDLVAAGSRSLHLYRGNGSGGFSLAETIDLPGAATALTASDVDSDGDLDVAVDLATLTPITYQFLNLGSNRAFFAAAPAASRDPLMVTLYFEQDVTGFGADDLVLLRNGSRININSVFVIPITASQYLIDLRNLTRGSGSYELTLNQTGSGISGKFGNLSNSPRLTWVIDQSAPTASLTAIQPNPRPTPVGTLSFSFTEAVTGFELNDLVLTRNQVPIDLSRLPFARLTNQQFTVDLSTVTATAGSYELRLRAATAGIRDLAGNLLGADIVSTWTTVEANTDSDTVPDSLEDLAPNNGDGNHDGVRDRDQPHVLSLRSPLTGELITAATEPTHTLAFARIDLPPVPDDVPAGARFVEGLVGLEVHNVVPGGAATVTLFLHGETHVDTFYKFGPTPGNPTPHWYRFLFNGTTGAQIFEDRIVLHLLDGQRGDNDLLANGVIVDPGAPAVDEREHPWQNPDLPVNVNDDNAVTPLDALLIITELNRGPLRNLPVPRPLPILAADFFDVSGDNVVAPLDALLVINDLNNNGPRVVNGAGEGEITTPAMSAQAESKSSDAAAPMNPAQGLVADRAGFTNDQNLWSTSSSRNPRHRAETQFSRRLDLLAHLPVQTHIPDRAIDIGHQHDSVSLAARDVDRYFSITGDDLTGEF
jgi:hypothetical protein